MNLLALLLPTIALLQPTGGPKFDVKLLADHSSIQPGGTVELAVELTIERGWHVYHPVILDTGAPTTIDFELPPGVTVGPLRFPAPKLGKEHDLEYLALEGRFAVLATAQLATDSAADSLAIKVTVLALACKELCVPVQAEATLKLPVSSAAPAAANEDLFSKARAAIPPTLSEALAGSRVLALHTSVPIGRASAVVALLRIPPEHGLVARDVNAAKLTATRLLIEKRDGVTFKPEAESWPAARDVAADVGPTRAYAGDVAVRAPFTIDDEKFEPGTVRLNALLRYQVLDPNGAALPPRWASGSVEFDVVPAGGALTANPDPALAALASAADRPSGAPTTEWPLPLVFLAAFVGGIILNIMPCVLPVISLKIFGFVRQAGDDPRRILQMGLVYALGIMASFLVLAALLAYSKLAWGGLMQKPEFLIGLAAVVFAFALSLLGVYEIQLPGAATNVAASAAAREGYGGAFLNGIMTTLLATPCVAPFLGSAVGVLAQQPAPIAFAGIMVVGLGLATPYVALTAFPGWLRYLPKPGPWMVTFKQIVGFILVLVVLWLISILIKSVEHGVLLGTLGLLCAVAIGAWLLGRITLSDSAARSLTLWAVALLVVFGGGWGSFRFFAERPTKIPWQAWSPGLAEKLAAEGFSVYVDYTADWCLTCQTNKKLALETDRVAAEFARRRIYPIKGDFTRQNPEMQRELQRHGRNGVPLNLILSADKPREPIVLPEILTPQIVLDALEGVPPSRAPLPF